MADGPTVAEKLLTDDLVAERAAKAALSGRLQLAHSALHVEQHEHEETKATLNRLRRALSKRGLNADKILAEAGSDG